MLTLGPLAFNNPSAAIDPVIETLSARSSSCGLVETTRDAPTKADVFSALMEGDPTILSSLEQVDAIFVALEQDVFSSSLSAIGVLRQLLGSKGAFPVVLARQGEPVYILGKCKPPLTPARHNVVQALLEAYPSPLTKGQLVHASGHSDAVNILKQIAKIDDDWKAVIELAGVTGGGYRITDPRRS